MTNHDPYDEAGRSAKGCLAGMLIIGGFAIGTIIAIAYWLTHL